MWGEPKSGGKHISLQQRNYDCVCYTRFPKMCLVQKVVSLVLYGGNCAKQVISIIPAVYCS